MRFATILPARRPARAPRRWTRRGLLGGLAAGIALPLALTAASGGAAAFAASGPSGASGATPNGVASMTPAQALATAASTLQAQANLVIVGTATGNGSRSHLDFKSAEHGTESAGTIAASAGAKALTIRFVILPADVYVQGGKGFWSQTLAGDKSLTKRKRKHLVRLLAGVWIELSPKQGSAFLAGFGSLTNPEQFTASLLGAQGLSAWGSPRTIDGLTAIPAITSTGNAVWLPETGPVLPVELTSGTASSAVGATGASGSSASSSSTAPGSDLHFNYPSSLTVSPPPRATKL